MDVYRILQQILDTHPASAPASETFDRILKILFTPAEAALAIHMSFKPKTVEEIARAAAQAPDPVAHLLDNMAAKAVIFSKEKGDLPSYGLVPTIPGLYEFPFMKGGGTPEHKLLGRLWEEYHRTVFGKAFSGEPTPQMRVVPIAGSITPINSIHPYEEVQNLINTGESIALAKCACRVSVAKCEAPLEVCIIFGGYARFLAERGFARLVSIEEALAALEKAEAAGLVHTSNNSADKPVVICNCCPCCCTVLRGRTQLKLPHAFAPSRFQAVVRTQACTGCGICSRERCPFSACALVDGVAVIDPERCAGCGLCVTGCPEKAIAFQERPDYAGIPISVQSMSMQVLQEKGKLDKFMELMR